MDEAGSKHRVIYRFIFLCLAIIAFIFLGVSKAFAQNEEYAASAEQTGLFTAEEQSYIENCPVLRASSIGGLAPFSYLDKSGSFRAFFARCWKEYRKYQA